MIPMLIWLAVSLLLAALCLSRPLAARIAIAVMFLVGGLGINLFLTLVSPQNYVEFLDNAWPNVYRTLCDPVVSWNPTLFGVFMIGFELIVAVLILGKGRAVQPGLFVGAVFLLTITPLGPEELPNPIVAAGMLYLATQKFDRDIVQIMLGTLSGLSAEHTHRSSPKRIA
jgi:hypothetical protein